MIVRKSGGYTFAEGLKRAQKHLEFYEEGLVIEVAARIIDAMEASGVTRSELARRLKVSPAYVTKILRGHANLSLESLVKLAFVLDLKWECILIPKHARVSLLAVTGESGGSTLRTVETATVEGLGGEPTPDENAQYAKGTRYELPLSA